ncbi:MAG: F0F1 ATP synthase subunit B [Deltaproteobacteria bacterium]|jgi:F-type H+-transporting ATPase subunit b|nr:F0F1 ATP synthase subunit B [Deltaproteobacteria bacterium]
MNLFAGKRVLWSVGRFLVAFALCSCFAAVVFASEGGGHEGGHGITHSQLMNFVWHILNFSILAVVLVKFLKKPITDALVGRREAIKASFDELDRRRMDAEAQYASYQKKMAEMDAEAERILKNFVEQGNAEKQKIIAQAKESAERVKMQAELYIQQEVARARLQLQREVGNMAVKMAGEIIQANITEEDHSRLINEYLERVVHKN